MSLNGPFQPKSAQNQASSGTGAAAGGNLPLAGAQKPGSVQRAQPSSEPPKHSQSSSPPARVRGSNGHTKSCYVRKGKTNKPEDLEGLLGH